MSSSYSVQKSLNSVRFMHILLFQNNIKAINVKKIEAILYIEIRMFSH